MKRKVGDSRKIVVKTENDSILEDIHQDDPETSAFQRNEKEKNNKINLRSARLIVRNLPFKSTESSIKEYFSKFGEVTDINVLKRGNKLVGCCFIQFAKKNSAAKAIAKTSGKDFMGRPIIVDWALPKDKFRKNIKKELESKDSEPALEEEEKLKSENEISDSDDESEEPIDSTISSHETSNSDESDQPDEEESDIEENNSEEDTKSKEVKIINEKKTKNKKFHFAYDPEDVSDGRTVFLKNVPFSASDDDLVECANKVGTVVYGVICFDPLTEHSKGTAFVKFNDKSIVDDLVNGKTVLVLKGVKLSAFRALKKTHIDNMKDKKCPKDNRNLYLLREGVVLAGSPAAEGVSEGDMSKRLQLEHWKTQTLKNLNKFVSNNRLVIHNIPPFVDDNKLRQIVKENSPKNSVITEARVMRNMKDIDAKGLGKSKGFAFVTFTKHDHALEALRKLNNNPTIFSDSKRPIVGFSIENMIALRVKEKRKLKSQDGAQKYKNNHRVKSETKVEGRKRKFSKVNEDNLPEFCGYTARPGAKKMRSGKELKMQALLHHKAVVDKKKSKKKIHFGRKWSKKGGAVKR